MQNATNSAIGAQGTATPAATKGGKNKGQISAGKGKAPKLATPPNALGALVALQQKQGNSAAAKTAQVAGAVTMPHVASAAHNQALAGFVRPVQNGRKGYAPNTIGALIWQTATALQAATPNTPIQASAVRLALPHVAPASVSAGLSHWRKFNGTLRVKGQPKAPAAPAGPSAAALAWVP